MDENIKKLKSLLKFYRNNGTKIELKVSYNEGTIVEGIITNMNCTFKRWIVLQSDGGSLMKVFLEDIYCDSIIVSEFAKKENKNSQQVVYDKKEVRDPISPKLRFDVFRRDKYVCQYCGACGPKVELEIDHIIPVSRGGTDDINNLKTSCFKCNRGKGDKV